MTARNTMTVSDYGIISFVAARISKFEILGRFTRKPELTVTLIPCIVSLCKLRTMLPSPVPT